MTDHVDRQAKPESGLPGQSRGEQTLEESAILVPAAELRGSQAGDQLTCADDVDVLMTVTPGQYVIRRGDDTFIGFVQGVEYCARAEDDIECGPMVVLILSEVFDVSQGRAVRSTWTTMSIVDITGFDLLD